MREELAKPSGPRFTAGALVRTTSGDLGRVIHVQRYDERASEAGAKWEAYVELEDEDRGLYDVAQLAAASDAVSRLRAVEVWPQLYDHEDGDGVA